MLRRWLKPAIVGLMFAGGGLSYTTFGSDLEKDTALRLAPKDADFFTSTMRMKEQWSRVIESDVAKEIMKSEWVQKTVSKYKEEWDKGGGQTAQVKMYLKTPLVQELLALAEEMFSDEFFILGDGQFSKFYVEANSLQKDLQSIIQSEGPEGVYDWIDELEKKDIDAIPIPTFVMGFKIDDTERALNLMDQLQGIISLGLNSVPQLAPISESFERVEDQRGTRLVITLASSMIPWDELPAGDEDQELVIEKMREVLEGRQISFSFGTLDKYLIFSVSETQAKIAELGERGSLAQNPLLKPLMDKSSEKIIGVGYVSDELNDAQFESQLNHYFSKLYLQIEPMIDQAFGEDIPEFLDPLEDDLEWLDENIGKFVPKFKGSLNFAILKGDSQEGYSYTRTKASLLDGSKPLDILQHVGESPVMMVALRHQYHPEWFQLSREIVKKAKNYLEGFRDSGMVDEGNKNELNLVLDKGWPILARVADIIESKFLPATKDGQHAWVLSLGNLKSKQWVKDMPESKNPLPLPEFATVTSLSDKDLLVSGFVELFSVFDSVVETVREVNPDSVPSGYAIPRPEKSSDGTYRYAIPDDCPVPKEMAPQVSIDEKVMVTTYSDKQTAALSSTKKLKVGSNLIDPSKPMAAASFIDLGTMSEMATPWIRYAFELQFPDEDAVLNEDVPDMPAMKVKDVMQIWGAFSKLGKFSSTTTVEKDGSTLTHWSYSK